MNYFLFLWGRNMMRYRYVCFSHSSKGQENIPFTKKLLVSISDYVLLIQKMINAFSVDQKNVFTKSILWGTVDFSTVIRIYLGFLLAISNILIRHTLYIWMHKKANF